MKKVMDSQARAAVQLIESVVQSSAALPDNLGQNLNVTA